MTDKNTPTTDEAQIREIIEQRVKAIDAKDLDALMSNHAADVLSFDLLDPLRSSGVETIKKRAEKWFSSYKTKIGYEVRDLKVTAGDAVAFCHYLYRVSGTLNDGGEVSMWVRATVCLQKTDGSWRIVHEHQSVPFDVKTGKASLDLQP